MATIELTKDNLDKLVQNSNILFIDFWADWCGPCKMFGPIFEQASEKHQDVVFAKCDTEQQQEVAAAFGVRSIPTLAIFKEQTMIFSQPGALPALALEEIIDKVIAIDMAEVRKEVAESEAKEKQSKKADA